MSACASHFLLNAAALGPHRELLARDAAVHALGAVVVVAGAAQLLAKELERRHVGVGELEGRGVERDAVETRGLAGQELDQHACTV